MPATPLLGAYSTGLPPLAAFAPPQAGATSDEWRTLTEVCARLAGQPAPAAQLDRCDTAGKDAPEGMDPQHTATSGGGVGAHGVGAGGGVGSSSSSSSLSGGGFGGHSGAAELLAELTALPVVLLMEYCPGASLLECADAFQVGRPRAPRMAGERGLGGSRSRWARPRAPGVGGWWGSERVVCSECRTGRRHHVRWPALPAGPDAGHVWHVRSAPCTTHPADRPSRRSIGAIECSSTHFPPAVTRPSASPSRAWAAWSC